jgi:hypothetical protein
MRTSKYLCCVLGETPEKAERFHASTLDRLTAYGIAIHIPVSLWMITGYVIPSLVFSLGHWAAAGLALLCGALIYMIERLILAMPKAWYVNTGRFAIGFAMAAIGASAFDLVIFDREIARELRDSGATRIANEYDLAIAEQRASTSRDRDAWRAAQAAANCEADGTCGSRVRSVGPIHRQLVRQAEVLRHDYESAQEKLASLQNERAQALKGWAESERALQEAGLLARVQALYQFTNQNPAALVTWSLFFGLILALELTVVFTKLAFGYTVDDRIAAIREEVSDWRARAYREAATSPVAQAAQLLHETRC